MQLLTFDFTDISGSLEIGDIGYFTSNTNTLGGFTTAITADIIAFGVVQDISRDTIPQTVTFAWDDSPIAIGNIGGQITYSTIQIPYQGDYIFFGKSEVVNSSSLLGYYAEVKFVNDSEEKAELFSVGSEISESSK